MKKTLVSMRIMQWMLAAILMTSGLGMLSSCQQIVEEQLQEVICQWVADFAEEGIDPETGLAYNRVVEVYDFSENNAGYYECYLLNGDELVNAEYVRGENGDFHYEVEGGLDYRSTIKQRKMDVCLDIKIVLLDWSYWWTVRYDDGLIDDGYHVLTPATEAQREQILKWYESRHTTGLAEKIIGKWITAEMGGQPMSTNRKEVLTFVSTTKAYLSASIEQTPTADSRWDAQMEADVVINGNIVTLTIQTEADATMVVAYTVSAINGSEFTANREITVTKGGNVVFHIEDVIRFEKVTADYTAAILGLWEGKVTSAQDTYGDGEEHRWEYKADGSFVYYVKDGDDWVPSANTLNEYFVDGNLLCMRWVDNGIEYREWWEIAIDGDTMNWTALRQNPDGTPFTATFSMTKVE